MAIALFGILPRLHGVITRKEIIVFVFFFASGIFGAWKFFSHASNINNTPEKIAQRIVNKALQEDMCERVRVDLNRFKESPSTYRRTSLKVIQFESKQTLRRLLIAQGIPEDFPIDFVGKGGVFDGCLSDVKAWLNVPSLGSQSLDSEYAELGLKSTEESKSKSVQAQAALGSNRVALVIGNSSYQNRPLKTPKADAEDMRDFLKTAGFEVIFIEDADFLTLTRGFNDFFDKLKLAEVSLTYYAGHGVEHKGRNYLLPVNFNVSDEDEIPRQAIDISSFVERISKLERKVNIVIVDACRSTFIPSKTRSYVQGLKKMEGARGTILAFSTAPGKVAEDGNGRNSPYAKHLLRSMSMPGRKIEDVFKETARNVEVETVGRQIPWYSSSLMVDFSLK
jgi:hypothetical protein